MATAEYGRIEALVQSGKLPYSTVSDLLRDACYHRLHWITEHLNDANLQDRLRPSDVLSDLTRRATVQAEYARQVEETIAKLDETMRYYSRVKADEGLVMDCLHEYRKIAVDLPEPHKSYVMEVIQKHVDQI